MKIFSRSFLILAIVIVLLASIVLLIPKTTASNGIITAEFSEKTVSSGETVYLTVTLKNNLGRDLEGVEISALPVDNSSLVVMNSEQFEDIIGMDEVREFKFPVTVKDDARAGVYSIKINSNLEDFKEIRVPLKVVEK